MTTITKMAGRKENQFCDVAEKREGAAFSRKSGAQDFQIGVGLTVIGIVPVINARNSMKGTRSMRMGRDRRAPLAIREGMGNGV